MRPLELTIKGFRSYRQEVTFDWRDRRLVGVVGPIGAGKSTILDAISLALYNKTPSVERDTGTLINQLSPDCRVRLVFEVDGEVWAVTRALRRKGASGHQLEHLESDAQDAALVEPSINQVAPIGEKITALIGMDFDAFCRSVMLAQNKFSQFLSSGAAARNEVLKKVFGYEKLDRAAEIAKYKTKELELKVKALEDRLGDAKKAEDELPEALLRAERARERLRLLEDAKPEVERMTKEVTAATAETEALGERLKELADIADDIPDRDEIETRSKISRDGAERLAEAAKLLASAEKHREKCRTELSDFLDQHGGNDGINDLQRRLDRVENDAQALESAAAELAEASEELERRKAELDAKRSEVADIETAAVAATAAAQEEEKRLTAAREALREAEHAEMALTIRTSLREEEPCPVCQQLVHEVPKATQTAKVEPLKKALNQAESTLAKAQKTAVEAGNRQAELAAQVREAEKALERATKDLDSTSTKVEKDSAALEALRAEISAALGKDDPRAAFERLLASRDQLDDAGHKAQEAVDTARRELDQQRDANDSAAAELAAIATTIAGACGSLRLSVGNLQDPSEVLKAAANIEKELQKQQEDVGKKLAAADEAKKQAGLQLSSLLAELGATDPASFIDQITAAASADGSAATDVKRLQQSVEAVAGIAAEKIAVEQQRGIAERLSKDLATSKFIAYLLSEQRAELAEIGSEKFEEMTDGSYRFSEDDQFDVLDLNAAGSVRKAASLSGGETFIASLALAIALAEMVSREGGRLDAFFLDEGFGSLDPEHLDRAMDGISRLVSDESNRLVVLVSHVAEMKEAIEDLIVLDKSDVTGDTIVVSGASRS